MFKPRSEFLTVMVDRGFLHQGTDLEALDALAAKEIVTGYIGFDATADSLHVGSLLQIMTLRWLQQTGHRPIALMGGGTTKIGDPSGKDESRQLLDNAAINRNIEGIRKPFDRLIDFSAGKAILANNADWLDGLAYIPLLRDVGRHFTINRMLTFDSVKLRLDREQPLTFLEFNYMILQAYDFLELSRRYGCRLQCGGSDQWGNIVNGVELGRRVDGAELFGLTTPLITTASGAKMGKTASGAVWLNEDRLSNWDFWQYWRNTEDADVGRFLKLFTDLPMDEVRRLEALQGAEINEAKKILANEVTRLVRGSDAAAQAAETARQTFEQGSASAGLPTVVMEIGPEGIPVWKALAASGLTASNGEARRLIKGGGAKVNDVAVKDEQAIITLADLKDGTVKLTAGKKNHALIKPTA